MPGPFQNTGVKNGLPPVYPVESVCWSCDRTVEGDPTAALRRCKDCDVQWKVELLPARPPAMVEQGSGTAYANRPWNQFIRALARPQRDGD